MYKKKIIGLFAALGLMLGLGFVGNVATTVAAPTPAEAYYLTVKVSPSSERVVRVCDLSRGWGICKNVGKGHWSPIAVQSIQVDHGCELFISGTRVAKRKGRDWYFNLDQTLHFKATISLKNCRLTGRGDVAPKN